MKTADAVQHYGGYAALASALSLSRAAVYKWGEDVPKLRAYELERLTNGALRHTSALEPAPAGANGSA